MVFSNRSHASGSVSTSSGFGFFGGFGGFGGFAMRKPRRPRGLRDLGFQTYELQLIGEIIVLCGLIEQVLRSMPTKAYA